MGRISIRLQPRSRINEIVGFRNTSLVVRVTAPPVDGQANDALCELLAERLGVSKGSVTVVHGASSRDKLVRVDGLSELELRRTLGL